MQVLMVALSVCGGTCIDSWPEGKIYICNALDLPSRSERALRGSTGSETVGRLFSTEQGQRHLVGFTDHI